MNKFFMTPAFGPLRIWHLLAPVALLYLVAGVLVAMLVIGWGMDRTIQHYRTEPVLSPRAFLIQRPANGAPVRGLYWLQPSSVTAADYRISLSSMGELNQHRVATCRVQRNSVLGQKVYESLKDGYGREMTWKLAYVSDEDIRIVANE